MLNSGIKALIDYLAAHVITCLVPAFFIAGAVSVFVSQASVLKYFGAQAKKYVAYSVASVSGTVLAVCSCTVLPLFAGIHKRGAGLGPAIAFLYSGPAINILAIVYTARLLGWQLGLGRAIGAILFSVVIGLIMAGIFRKEEKIKEEEMKQAVIEGGKESGKLIVYFGILVSILIFATAKIDLWLKIITVVNLILMLGIVLNTWFEKYEILDWFSETYRFVKMIFPILLVGVFIAGMLKTIIPQQFVAKWVGGNSLSANFIASIVGAFMYFATLTEVPILKAFLELGMGKGPALALLLAGPALSLPSMIVLIRIMGGKKTSIYCTLVVIMATITGIVFGKL
ncbi:MAG: hypothetical protein COS84_05735 [Armatimonadetes bacterium CG07_land_8_20_14_0_80_40_9]|nr:MAG: hypothetical protein COS84_05735 [Armatimonadetes bacterium CG07_land_8_20_14_0_80_40_9]